MMRDAKKNGLWGEIYVARALREAGYEICSANYRTRLGEVDIIARKEEVLVFCEVKTRLPHSYGMPREAVDRHKQRRIAAAAMQYVKTKNYHGVIRFDVAEVTLSDHGTPDIHFIENAFDGESAGFRGL